jgi:hypothetical protein
MRPVPPRIAKGDIERLFAHMARLFGASFVDKWRDVPDDEDMTELKATWRNGLADISPEQFARGVQSLFSERAAPDLPRFRALCQNVMEHTSTQLALTGPRVITPVAAEALATIRATLEPIRERMRAQEEQAKAKAARASEAVMLPAVVPSPHVYQGFSDAGELARAALAEAEAIERKHAMRRAASKKRSREPGEDDEPFEPFGGAHGFDDPHATNERS